jgi:hypothetical protein
MLATALVAGTLALARGTHDALQRFLGRFGVNVAPAQVRWFGWSVVVAFVPTAFLLLVVSLALGSPAANVEIIPLSNKIEIVGATNVRGTSSNIPAGHEIWVLVRGHGAPQFHPQPGPVRRAQSGKWTARVQLGADSLTKNARFDVVAVVASREASVTLANYLENAISTGRFAGVALLPEGTEVKDEVTVEVAARGVTRLTKKIVLEAEQGNGAGRIMQRSRASGRETVQLSAGQRRTLDFQLGASGRHTISARYSNDNANDKPTETVTVRLDGRTIGRVKLADTGDSGFGWNVFRSTGTIASVRLRAGTHVLVLVVNGGDGFGVEIDFLALARV